MPTITQNLTVPAGLADGQTAFASQVVTLYQAMNAFVIPDTVGVFQQGFVDSTLYTTATGASQDWAVTATKDKALIFMIGFSWSGAGAAPTYTLRHNGGSLGATLTMTNTPTTSGFLVGFIGGHDADAPRPVMFLGIDAGSLTSLKASASNADLTTSDTSSIGITVGGAGNTTKFKYVKIWREG